MEYAVRYYQYDYDRRVVTEYARRGQCSKCGDCCRAFIAFQRTGNAVRGEGLSGGDSAQLQGLWNVVDDGQELRRYKMMAFIGWANRCTHLGCDSLCSKYEDSCARGAICIDWPMGPKCTEDLPTCGYWFESIGSGVLEDAISEALELT